MVTCNIVTEPHSGERDGVEVDGCGVVPLFCERPHRWRYTQDEHRAQPECHCWLQTGGENGAFNSHTENYIQLTKSKKNKLN